MHIWAVCVWVWMQNDPINNNQVNTSVQWKKRIFTPDGFLILQYRFWKCASAGVWKGDGLGFQLAMARSGCFIIRQRGNSQCQICESLEAEGSTQCNELFFDTLRTSMSFTLWSELSIKDFWHNITTLVPQFFPVLCSQFGVNLEFQELARTRAQISR